MPENNDPSRYRDASTRRLIIVGDTILTVTVIFFALVIVSHWVN